MQNLELLDQYTVSLDTEEYYIEIWGDGKGYFEHHEYGDEDSGQLWFNGIHLDDFDGCMVLPLEVAEAINSASIYRVDIEHFCR